MKSCLSVYEDSLSNFIHTNFLANSSFFKNKFIYLFLAALGLHCCVWVFSSCSKQGQLFVAVCGLLIVVASLAAEHGL